jgi:hypothetical protein
MVTKTIPFSSVKRDKVVDILGLDLSHLNSHVDMLRLPPRFRRSRLSEEFDNRMKMLAVESHLKNVAGQAEVIKEFIREALRLFPTELQLYLEEPLSWVQDGVRFRGSMDMAVMNDTKKSLFPVGEVKRAWDIEEGLYQLLAEAGCILRMRESQGKQPTPVLAVLSNAFNFQFFAIDERNGCVYSSQLFVIDLLRIADFRSDPQVIEVVTWLVWFIQITVSVSPTCSPRDHPEDGGASKLQELRRCFRP